MDNENWPEIKHVLDQLLALPHGEREQRLKDLCANDANLLASVQSYLLMEGKNTTLFEAPFVHPTSTEGKEDPYREGQSIGIYQIKELLGTGGMGVVYLAHRNDDLFQKDVAIKILKHGLATKEIGRKFNNERQILANLNHPYIARLFDGGTTESGDPYFVMEFVQGEHLDRFIENHLSLTQRLELFQKICAAVGHAHEAGVIHRDLKPSNILVTKDGSPKLLDFGIAKIFDPTHGDDSKTQTHFHLMTPKFASPEQISEQPIQESSDVYSLGTLLYIILTGHHPLIEPGDPPSTIRERICKKKPIPPSQRMKQELKDSPTGSTSTDRSTLSYIRRLTGDLDQIVMHCLEKLPDLRYPSVLSLSEDIRRHQQGLPILAKPTPVWVKLKKAIFRNPIFSGSIAMAFLVFLSALTWIWVEKRNVNQDKSALDLAHDDAKKKLDRAEAIFAFGMSVFDQFDPMVEGNNRIPTLDVVEAATEKLDFSILGPLENRSGAYKRLAEIYYHLLQFDRAKEYYQELVAIYTVQPGDDPENLSQSKLGLAHVLQAMRSLDEAEELFREALCLAEEIHGLNHPKTATYISGLATNFEARAQTETAVNLAQHALTIFHPLAAQEKEVQASLLQTYATTLRRQGRFEEAEESYFASISLRHQIYSQNHPLLGYSFVEIGYMYRNWSKNRHAIDFYTEALSIFESKLGPDHAALALVLGRIGAIKRMDGNFEEAEHAYLRGIRNIEMAYGTNYSGLAVKYNDIGVLYKTWGKYEEAIPFLEKSIAIIETYDGNTSRSLLFPINSLALVYIELHELEKTEKLFQRAQNLITQHFTETHQMAMPIWGGLCSLRTKQGLYKEAEKYGALALELAKKYYSEAPINLSWYFRMMADLKRERGLLEEAEMLYFEIVSSYREDSDEGPFYLFQTLVNLGTLYAELSQWELSTAYLLEGLSLIQHSPDNGHEEFQNLVCIFLDSWEMKNHY